MDDGPGKGGLRSFTARSTGGGTRERGCGRALHSAGSRSPMSSVTLDDGAAFIDRALVLNPNLASSWYFSGWMRVFLGELELAIKHFAHSMRLSPLDPLIFLAKYGTGSAHFFAGRYDEASSWAQKSLQESPNYHGALRIFAASNALAGRLEDAQKAMTRLREIDPDFRISDLRNVTHIRRPEHFARYAEGLRKAGLPD